MIVQMKPVRDLTDKDEAFLLVAHAMMTAAERGYVNPAPIQTKSEGRAHAKAVLEDGIRLDTNTIKAILQYCQVETDQLDTLVRIAELILEQEATRPEWQEEACNDEDKSWR